MLSGQVYIIKKRLKLTPCKGSLCILDKCCNTWPCGKKKKSTWNFIWTLNQIKRNDKCLIVFSRFDIGKDVRGKLFIHILRSNFTHTYYVALCIIIVGWVHLRTGARGLHGHILKSHVHFKAAWERLAVTGVCCWVQKRSLFCFKTQHISSWQFGRMHHVCPECFAPGL